MYFSYVLSFALQMHTVNFQLQEFIYFDTDKSMQIFYNLLVKTLSNSFLLFFQIPVLAVEIAMDHKPSHREMTSVLISDLYGRVVTQRDIGRGWF